MRQDLKDILMVSAFVPYAIAVFACASALFAAPGTTRLVEMVATGECQRFDGVMVFPLTIKDPRSLCADMHGLWVPHVVSTDEAPKPGFYPYK